MRGQTSGKLPSVEWLECPGVTGNEDCQTQLAGMQWVRVDEQHQLMYRTGLWSQTLPRVLVPV